MPLASSPDEASSSASKKRKHEHTADVSESQTVNKKKKRKTKDHINPGDHQESAAEDNIDPHLFMQSNGDSQSTMSIFSAIVAAATGQPGPSYANPSETFISDEMNLHPNDAVLQALHEIDVTKIASVLKALGDAAVAADAPFEAPTSVLPPVSVTAPQPLGQIPLSSEAILKHPENQDLTARPSIARNQPQYTHNVHAELLATRWLNSSKLNALAASEGLVYKKGKFSALEEQQVRTAIEHYRLTRQITQEQLEAIIFPKNEGDRDNAFWTEVAYAVPQRPLMSVYHYVRRAYHPLKPQGKWLPSEDDRLREAVANLGQQWEKVSEVVGRRAPDCRDRYRNHIMNRELRASGSWSAEEEAELTRIVTEMTVSRGKDMDNDVFWGLVSAKMGGKRGRQQCRIKWTDSLSHLVKNEGKRTRWSSRDAYILVQKIDSLNIHDDTEIDWKTLPDPNWNLYSAHALQRRWYTMKRSIKGYEDMSHQEIMDILKAKKSSYTVSEVPSTAPKQRKTFPSADFVSESDSEIESSAGK